MGGPWLPPGLSPMVTLYSRISKVEKDVIRFIPEFMDAVGVVEEPDPFNDPPVPAVPLLHVSEVISVPVLELLVTLPLRAAPRVWKELRRRIDLVGFLSRSW